MIENIIIVPVNRDVLVKGLPKRINKRNILVSEEYISTLLEGFDGLNDVLTRRVLYMPHKLIKLLGLYNTFNDECYDLNLDMKNYIDE